VTFLIIGIFSFNPILAFYYHQTGKKAFNNKKYQEAVIKFKQSVDKCPGNLGYRYYYAESLAYVFKLEEAQKEFKTIIKIAPLSRAAGLSQSEFKKIQDYLDQKENYRAFLIKSFARKQDNYINSVTINGNIVHWNLKKMPLRVFIDNSEANHAAIIKNALDSWMIDLGGLLSYKLVTEPEKADIKISFTREISKYESKEGDIESSAGITQSHIEGKILKSVDIRISTISPDNQQLSQLDIYTIALHEIGHSLGIAAHSYYASDIMYPIMKDRPKLMDVRLSHRDINTVKLLYKLDADISNFDPGDVNNKHFDLNSAVLGSKSSRFNNELQEARNYISVSPNSPFSWTKLGEAYHNLKQNSNAIYALKKALEIDPKYVGARERLAFVYFDINDKADSIVEFRNLISADPANTAYSGNLALIYIGNNQYDEAREVIDALIAVNPKAKEDETIKNISLALGNKNIKLQIVNN